MIRLRPLLAAAVLLLPLSLFAAPVSAPTAFDRFMSLATGAGKTTVTLGSDGTPLAAPGVPTINADGSLPKYDNTGTIRNPAGNPVPVAATGRVSAAEVGKVAGRGLVNVGVKFLGVLAAGVAIYDLAKELNYLLTKNADGTVSVQKSPTYCPTAPCYEYLGPSSPLAGFPWDKSPQTACGRMVGRTYFGRMVTGSSAGGTPAAATCFVTYSSGSPESTNMSTRTRAVDTVPVYEPATHQEFVDAVAAKSGWPSNSAISRVIAEAGTGADEKVKVGPLTVTGPATSPGAQKVTQNATNNTTKTETTTYNHTYQGDTITTTAVTVTNITNNTTGDTISSETKTETPEKEEDPPKEVANDTPLPDQPKLYTPKYPNGLEGVWAQQKANLTSTPLVNLIGKLMPNVGSSGTCPTWNLDLTFSAWADFGLRDFAPPCYVWDWARLIILVSALLLARALIFGG